MKYLAATILSCATFMSPISQALVYDEAVDGDLPGDRFSSPVLLELDAGVNTISGTIASSGIFGNEDFDFFRIAIPSGYQAETFLFSAQSIDTGSGTFLSTEIYAEDDTQEFFRGNFAELPVSQMLLFGGEAFASGEYLIWFNSLASLLLPDGELTVLAGYEIEIRLTPVPVPAAFWLFGSALFGLGVGRRRLRE